MSALFTQRPGSPSGKPKERRTSALSLRMRVGLFTSYSEITGASEFDTFQRDAKTWAAFENAALPELERYRYFDAQHQRFASPQAVLADAMYHIWMATDLGLDLSGRPTTIRVIREVANYLCAVYEVKCIDRRQERSRVVSS